ncbi:MAG: HTH domain-containing protein [Desulfurococcales archaeon]|jgi:predicted transcriptional regulator|nr:HTH domain-containing protein [Desulfurococcales archaeon]
MSDKRKVDPIEILKILDQMSTGTVNLSHIAKRFGVSRQNVYKHMKRLFEKGFVTKDEKGHYILTERGRTFIRNAPKINSDDYSNIIKLLERGIEYFLERKDVEKDQDIGVSFIYYSLAVFFTYSIVAAAQTSLAISERNMEMLLERIWSNKLKDLFLRMSLIMAACGEREWEALRGFFEAFKLYGQGIALKLDRYLQGSQRIDMNDKDKSYVS